jgi:hypothetical protein
LESCGPIDAKKVFFVCFEHISQELREQIKPYFLRRMKNQVCLDSGISEKKKH